MDDIHLSRELLRAVDDGHVPMEILDAIKTEHLLSRCPHCRAEVEAHKSDHRARTSLLSRFLQIVSTLLGRLVSLGSREVARAEQEQEELLLLPQDARVRHIERARSRFRSPALVRLLLEESRRHAALQPQMSFHLAELAEAIANRNPRMPGYFELYALAKAQMANACRVGNDRRQANELFAVARQIMADYGVTNPEVVGRVDELMASLYKDQRQFQDAERLLKRAALQFGLVQATKDAARALIILGDTYCAAGSPEQAIETTRSALTLLDPESDLRLLVLSSKPRTCTGKRSPLSRSSRRRFARIGSSSTEPSKLPPFSGRRAMSQPTAWNGRSDRGPSPWNGLHPENGSELVVEDAMLYC